LSGACSRESNKEKRREQEMRTFAVYESPKGECEAVKIGVSWPAFFFGCLWAFARGLWLRGVALLGIEVLLALVAGIAAAFVGLWFELTATQGEDAVQLFWAALFIPYSIMVGLWANGWRRKHLVKKGYTLMNESVLARSGEEAITTVKPELIPEDRLLKRAHKMMAEGKTEEAELVLQRLVREHKDDENVVKVAKEELEQIRLKAA
jgi:phosphate/sulfate permease